MINTCLSDEERLEEIGRLLALGAVRLLKSKKFNSSKKRLAAAPPPTLIATDGEKFAAENCLPGGLSHFH